MTKPLPRTTIRQMPLPHPKNKFKYCFEMSNYGGEQRAELEAWCNDAPDRRWGNMGYVECQSDADAIEFITTWGINCRTGALTREQSAQRREDRKARKSELGYSRIGLGNV